jgi:DNA mismatch repair protein MutS
VATHYHELAALGQLHPQVSLMRATVQERADQIDFPHLIERGAADRSYGIEVARLAGLPSVVLDRARLVSRTIEPINLDVASRIRASVADPARL